MNEKAMMAADLLQRIMETAKAAVPDSISEDLRANVKAAIQDVIKELDVVTRDELEIQQEVLSKTRAKVDQLEKLVAELEAKL